MWFLKNLNLEKSESWEFFVLRNQDLEKFDSWEIWLLRNPTLQKSAYSKNWILRSRPNLLNSESEEIRRLKKPNLMNSEPEGNIRIWIISDLKLSGSQAFRIWRNPILKKAESADSPHHAPRHSPPKWENSCRSPKVAQIIIFLYNWFNRPAGAPWRPHLMLVQGLVSMDIHEASGTRIFGN